MGHPLHLRKELVRVYNFLWWAGMEEAGVRSGPPIPWNEFGDIIPYHRI